MSSTMKKLYIPILSFLFIPSALFGSVLLAYARNRHKASRFYDGDGHPRDDGTRLTLPAVKMLEVLPCPVTDDRARIGPIKFQQLLGSPNPPWRPIGKDAVYRTLAYLKEKGIQYVAPSAHDTCDWSLHAFEETFGVEYHPLQVGELLRIEEKNYAQQTSQ